MVLANLRMDNCHICYRNFSGTPKSMYDRPGDRKFSIILEEQQAVDLQSQGWPVKMTPAKNGDGMWCTLPVKLGQYNPPVYQKSDVAMVKLTGDMLNGLDQIEIDHVDCDLQLVPYDNGAKKGNTVYVKSMCVYQNIDRFSAMYERANRVTAAVNAAPDVQTPPVDSDSDLPF